VVLTVSSIRHCHFTTCHSATVAFRLSPSNETRYPRFPPDISVTAFTTPSKIRPSKAIVIESPNAQLAFSGSLPLGGFAILASSDKMARCQKKKTRHRTQTLPEVRPRIEHPPRGGQGGGTPLTVPVIRHASVRII
jgi:hypothetical protein